MIKPVDYFNRYSQYLGTGISPNKAFLCTEREFYKLHGMRRFKSFNAFRRSYWLYRLGRHGRLVVLHIVDDFEIKK